MKDTDSILERRRRAQCSELSARYQRNDRAWYVCTCNHHEINGEEKTNRNIFDSIGHD
jgi:hypothetical protein